MDTNAIFLFFHTALWWQCGLHTSGMMIHFARSTQADDTSETIGLCLIVLDALVYYRISLIIQVHTYFYLVVFIVFGNYHHY